MNITDKDAEISSTDLNFKMPLLMLAILFVGYMLLNKDNQPEQLGNTDKRIETLISSKKLLLDTKDYINQPFDLKRANAISNTKCKEYKNTIQSIVKIENKTNQDYYFLAYAYMKKGQPRKASENFAQSISMSDESGQLVLRSRTLQIISIIQSGDFEEARRLYDGLEKDSWPKNRLKAIMDTLKN